MTAHHRHGLPFHATAGAAALAALPWLMRGLRIASSSPLPTGGAYGLAWALIAAAWVFHRLTGWWIAWASLLATIAGLIADLPAVHQSITYLTGATW